MKAGCAVSFLVGSVVTGEADWRAVCAHKGDCGRMLGQSLPFLLAADESTPVQSLAQASTVKVTQILINHENKGLIVSETIQAMPIKFAVKTV